MFDIGFGELMLVMVIGLVVLGPERLPVAVKTVAGWIRTLRSLASTVQNELSQELKLQELQDSLKKVEQASLKNLSPELKASMDELKEAADSMRRGYVKPLGSSGSPIDSPETQTMHQPLADAEAAHDGVLKTENAVVSTPGVEPEAIRSAAIEASVPPRIESPDVVPELVSRRDDVETHTVSGQRQTTPDKQLASADVSTVSSPLPRDDR